MSDQVPADIVDAPVVTPAEGSPKRWRLASLQRWQWWTIGAACMLMASLLLAVAADVIASTGRVHPGVSVGNVAVGGLTYDAATKRLAAELPKQVDATVTAVYADKKFVIKPSQMNLSFDYAALTDRAMAVGRSGGAVAIVKNRVAAWTKGVTVASSVNADPTNLKMVIESLSTGVNVAATDASVRISGMKFSLLPAATGLELDTASTATKLLSAFTSSSHSFDLPVNTVQPKISDAAAQSAKSVAERMISTSVTVTYTDKKWSFGPSDIAKVIAFRAVESTSGTSASWSLEPYVGAAETSVTIVPKLGAGIGRLAQNATFKTSGDQIVVVPSQEGVGPDVVGLAADLTTILKSTSTERTVALRVTAVQPTVTTQQAKDMGVKDKIATFTTTFDSGNAPRVNNIQTLGSALDGQLVAPGAVFSLNGAAGERTAEKGYQEAGAILDGKLVQQFGGGICQVATTMFNTIFFSGLPIIERSNHSVYIAHYPTGRDATVSWDGPDLKWKNNTANWVLVSVSYTSSSITVSLYGTNPGYGVSYTTSPLTNSVPFTTQEIADPTLPVGTRIVVDGGVNGVTCVVTRTVSKNGQVIGTDTFKSVYQPNTEVVRVGTMPTS